jgi:uncharacterized membrane protein
MEVILKDMAGSVALAAEMICVLCVAVGAVTAVVKAVRYMIARHSSGQDAQRDVWRSFAAWIILALEFALAADIVRSAIAPSWNDIGKLAAIAVIRTGLNYFLEKDMQEFGPSEAEKV